MTVTIDTLAAEGITGDDMALDLQIRAAYADIEARFGPAIEQVELYTLPKGARKIWLKKKIKTVTKVEQGKSFLAADLTEIQPNVEDGYIFAERAISLVNSHFSKCVKITYLSVDDDDRRDRTVIELLKLSQRYKDGGLIVQKRVGNFYQVYDSALGTNPGGGYQLEREKILSALAVGPRMMA